MSDIYTLEKATEALRNKVQEAVNTFREESGGIYAVDIRVRNQAVTVINNSMNRYVHQVAVHLEAESV